MSYKQAVADYFASLRKSQDALLDLLTKNRESAGLSDSELTKIRTNAARMRQTLSGKESANV